MSSLGIIENLTAQLTKLPGVGRKTAQRLAFYILSMSESDAKGIAQAIVDVKDKAGFCRRCFNITETELCNVCADHGRDQHRICVVEEPSNISVIERTGVFKGTYHVLLGALSPIDGITPERLKIEELIVRVKQEGTEEVIVATNPNTKGEMTAKYLREVLTPLGVAVTRIAYGLPMGGDIEFADEVTMRKSLEGRHKI